MGFILIGFLLISLGLCVIFARDFWWEVQKFGNQLKGQVSERTTVWDISNILFGVVLVGVGLWLSWQGVGLMAQPVVPRMCAVHVGMSDSANPDYKRYVQYDRNIETGCAAAQKKDYQTALTHFRQALDEIDRQPMLSSYRQRTSEAIALMKRKTGK